jgi:peptidoglycan/xylan/chitin deacetylase (PgdA/CDA1 family)
MIAVGALRSLVKTAAAEAACRTGADRMIGALAEPTPLVIGYHQVVDDAARATACIPAMLVRTRTLERQLDEVGRRFRFVSLDELGERLTRKDPAVRSLAAVTFDDGYRDVYESAFPLLRRKGIPAAVFVVTDLVGTARLQTHDRLYLTVARLQRRPGGLARLRARLRDLGIEGTLGGRESDRPDPFTVTRNLIEGLRAAELERLCDGLAAVSISADGGLDELRPLTWEMVADMHRAGITIGSHTRTHARLTHESPDRIAEELASSRAELERRLGAPVRHFAYPDGGFDPAVVDGVAAAGYRFAYTTCRHRDARAPLLTVPRRLFWENTATDGAGRYSSALMRCQASGVFDFVRGCRQAHRRPAAARTAPRPA